MGATIVKIKIMPSSPDINLEEIKIKAETISKEIANSEIKIEEEPIAFGLKAVILQFSFDESKNLESIEEKIRAIKNVSSLEIIDFRRAFG